MKWAAPGGFLAGRKGEAGRRPEGIPHHPWMGFGPQWTHAHSGLWASHLSSSEGERALPAQPLQSNKCVATVFPSKSSPFSAGHCFEGNSIWAELFTKPVCGIWTHKVCTSLSAGWDSPHLSWRGPCTLWPVLMRVTSYKSIENLYR